MSIYFFLTSFFLHSFLLIYPPYWALIKHGIGCIPNMGELMFSDVTACQSLFPELLLQIISEFIIIRGANLFTKQWSFSLGEIRAFVKRKTFCEKPPGLQIKLSSLNAFLQSECSSYELANPIFSFIFKSLNLFCWYHLIFSIICQFFIAVSNP